MNGLGAAMREAAEDVDVRTGFTGDVLRGGRRRQTRRRIGIALAAAMVVGLAGFSAGLAVQHRADVPHALDGRLLEPTKGNLANDPARLRSATAVWQTSLTLSWKYDRGVTELQGEPHVYWVATTEAGDAAVVMQAAQVRNQWRTLVGLVGRDPADGSQKLLGSTSPGDPDGDKESFQFGPGDRTFLMVDPRISVYLSPSATRNAEGVVRRTWQEVPIVDGVGLWTTPEGADPSTVRLVTSLGPPTVSDIPLERQLNTYPASAYLRDGYHARRNGEPDTNSRRWQPVFPAGSLLFGAGGTPPPETDPEPILRQAGVLDIGPRAYISSWNVRGTTGDGTGVLVCEALEGSGPGVLYAVLYRPDGTPDRVVRGSAVVATSPAPVRVHLPDGRGWVVASAEWATLRYRTSPTGEWLGAVANAALFPDDAINVQVSPTNGAQAEVVDLPR